MLSSKILASLPPPILVKFDREEEELFKIKIPGYRFLNVFPLSTLIPKPIP